MSNLAKLKVSYNIAYCLQLDLSCQAHKVSSYITHYVFKKVCRIWPETLMNKEHLPKKRSDTRHKDLTVQCWRPAPLQSHSPTDHSAPVEAD